MTRDEILAEAGRLVSEDRMRDYGPPDISFRRIADGWSHIIGADVSPRHVALCMAWLKISRATTCPGKADSYIDCAAYIAVAAELGAHDDR